jgi:hypothetical protein
MQQPNQRELDVSTLTVAARTVVLEGSSIDGPEPPGLFDAAIDALAHWKAAAAMSLLAFAGLWLATEGSRTSIRAEFLVRAPVDEYGQMRSASDVAKSIELIPVPRTGGKGVLEITAKADKPSERSSDLISVSAVLPKALAPKEVRGEVDRIVSTMNAALAPALKDAVDALTARIESVDASLAEAKAILDSPEKLPAQSDAIGVVMAESVKLREERMKLMRRRASASELQLVGEVRVPEPKLLSTGTLAPPLLAACAFVITAFTLRGFAQARARRAAAAAAGAGAGARN